MHAVSITNAEHYLWGEGCDGWRFLKDPNCHVIRERVPPGKAETRHVHAKAQQFFYILAGRAAIEIDGQQLQLCAGEGVHVPAGKPHRFMNPFSEAVEFLVISNPTTRGDRKDLA
ncbi:cupin domain-containing protein [Comamonas sp. NLF-1-9]|uniref:cupin domain-containing protein n=1 Tax=Comamonas sp. NLF-1-9 TaxID=2853163 RepID=UPI001C453CD7|nr:cupin domain-containing protein [Comamonas sp. NLF-1-9]QXL85179.1 cupin domain-containing protein [Comamonas sp. NLF-1-9]